MTTGTTPSDARNNPSQSWSRDKVKDLVDSMKKEFTSGEMGDALNYGGATAAGYNSQKQSKPTRVGDGRRGYRHDGSHARAESRRFDAGAERIRSALGDHRRSGRGNDLRHHQRAASRTTVRLTPLIQSMSASGQDIYDAHRRIPGARSSMQGSRLKVSAELKNELLRVQCRAGGERRRSNSRAVR